MKIIKPKQDTKATLEGCWAKTSNHISTCRLMEWEKQVTLGQLSDKKLGKSEKVADEGVPILGVMGLAHKTTGTSPYQST